jgi:ABC-type proline/glycine betaine transport system ATPase subunit
MQQRVGLARAFATNADIDIVEHPADDYVAEFVQHVNPRTAIKATTSA